jgi:hypothetical protein
VAFKKGVEMERWQRWSPLSGVVFVVLFVLAVVVLGNTGDTPQEVLDYYTDNEGQVFTGFFILVASALAFLWFVATVRRVLASAEDEPRPLTALGFGAGVATSALIVAASAVFVAPVDVAQNGGQLDAGAADVLDTVAYFLVTGGVMVASLLVVATSLVALRAAVVPRWLAWAGFIVAPISFFAPVFFPVLVFLAWVLAVSVALLMRARTSDGTEPREGASGLAA